MCKENKSLETKYFDEGRYQYYVFHNKVVCVSSYEGRAVRAVAKCAKDDVWDINAGKALARARVDVKIANKRRNRAEHKVAEARVDFEKAKNRLVKMQDYYQDANLEITIASSNLDNLLKKL